MKSSNSYTKMPNPPKHNPSTQNPEGLQGGFLEGIMANHLKCSIEKFKLQQIGLQSKSKFHLLLLVNGLQVSSDG